MSDDASLNFEQSLWRDKEVFRLAPGEAHVWSISLEGMPALYKLVPALLPEEEWAQSRRFEKAAHGRAFLSRRILLRQILARYASCRPADITYKIGDRGKPHASGAADGIGFNASSSGPRVLLAFIGGAQIGVDVEEVRWRPGLEAVALQYFNAAEQARLAGLPQDQRQRQFFQIWTRKEAMAKLSGEGLSALDHGGQRYQQALCEELPLGEGLVGYVAAADPKVKIRIMHWAPAWEHLVGTGNA